MMRRQSEWKGSYRAQYGVSRAKDQIRSDACFRTLEDPRMDVKLMGKNFDTE